MNLITKKSFVLALGLAGSLTTYAKGRLVNEKELRALEESVWTYNEFRLISLEEKIIRQIQIYPDQAFSYYLLAHLRLREFTNTPEDLAVLRQAAELGEQAVDLDPQSDVGYVALAETMDLMGQSKKGVQLLETAANSGMEPTWRYYFTLARLHADSASKEKVLALLEQALGFQDSQPDIVIPYVVAVFQTTVQGADLVAKLHEWDRKFPNILFKQTIAITLADSGKHEQAHKIYKHIYTVLPHYSEAMINDAILLYKHLNNPKEAVQLFEKVLLSESKDGHDPELDQMIYSHLGAARLKLQDFKKAEETFMIAITAHDAHRAGILDFVAKNYREARHSLHLYKLIKRLTGENNPTGLMYAIMGETLSEDLKRHHDALESFENAILLEPARSDFYTGMGLTYYRMKNQEQALALFKEANRIDPNDATAKYNQACALALLGRTQQALGILQEAISLDPRLVENAKNDEDFANMNKTPAFIELVGNNKKQQPTLPANDLGGEDILSH